MVTLARINLRWTQLTGALICTLLLVASQPAQAQFSVIHNFSGAGDGGNPYVGLTMDAAGNFYGTTYNGGNQACFEGCGIVFKLMRSGSGWTFHPLYSFAGGNDGAHPYSRVTIAADGTLYGTTYYGGGTSGCGSNGCGTIYHLTAPPNAPRNALPTWDETVIHRFSFSDGAAPQGDLTFDAAGNIYGTTIYGGSGGGVIYELTPSGGSWTQTVLYTPEGTAPFYPYGGVILDAAGNLYGVFNSGPNGPGAVYELSKSGSSWTERSIYAFTGGSDGSLPVGGLIFDSAGNLYGTTTSGGDPDNPDGTAFQLVPSGGNWIFNLLWTFGPFTLVNADDKLMIDSAGNLYGTTFYNGGRNAGTIYELVHSNNYMSMDLHDFAGSDGANPMSIIVSDANGNFYGTAIAGGSSGNGCAGGHGCGVIWEIAR